MSEDIHISMSAVDDGRICTSVDGHFSRSSFAADACTGI